MPNPSMTELTALMPSLAQFLSIFGVDHRIARLLHLCLLGAVPERGAAIIGSEEPCPIASAITMPPPLTR